MNDAGDRIKFAVFGHGGAVLRRTARFDHRDRI